MPLHQRKPFPVTWDQVAAFRLKQHHLMARAASKDIPTVVRDMAGAQAQLLSAAQISLWSRIQNLDIAQVEEAIIKRTLVKAACMRRTLFLVPSDHLAIFVRGSAKRAEKEIRWARNKGVPARTIENAIAATLSVLDEPLTRPEIAERTCRALGVQLQAYRGGGWGSRRKLEAVPVGELNYPVVELLHLVGARGVVCYGPYRGNEPTFVRADAWIPGWQDMPQEQAEDELLRIYLRAYGPSTPVDFALWAGFNLTEARQIWARVQSGLAAVDVEGWEAVVLREDLDPLAQAVFEGPNVRLLPFFDSFLLGHKGRDHLVDSQHHQAVYRPQGWISPVVLVNGRAQGVWEYTQEKNSLRVEVTKFGGISPSISNMINEEAQDLARFLESPEVDLHIH